MTSQINQRAIVTGVHGQDGYYLSKLLLDRGYEVIGIYRRHSSRDYAPSHYHPKYQEIGGDICDTSFMLSLIKKEQPSEFYNLAAQSHVGYSFENPDTTFDVNANAVLGMLEAIRLTSPHTKFYQASTSEMFGTVASGMATEQTTLSPASPYGVAKTAAHHMVRVYRESYGLFACSGILFNHESSRRGKDFVTRKITSFVADYKRYVPTGQKLKLGNIESVRDWGWAPEYVEAMWQMLQQDVADDFVIATGNNNSLQHFAETVFGLLDLDFEKHVVSDKDFFRPADIASNKGNAQKAAEILGWKPRTDMAGVAEKMLQAQLGQAEL